MSEIVTILMRTVIMFVVVLFVFRLLGKKEFGELTIIDFAVSLMIAELAVIAIEDLEVSLIRGISPILLLGFLQLSLESIELKSQAFRDIVEGRPVMIIEEGKLNQHNMKKNKYDLDDMLFQLREQGISDIREVEYAVLERSGNLSIFKKGDNFTVPLIQDGDLLDDNLRIIKKNKEWLLSELDIKGYKKIKDIFYCSYMNGEFFIEMKQKR
ncbi:uncharacterized membrane protein YcaP (DUF421 family) [Natranaerovirga pectinivora]|uniref:Uncharacterized membrane protein YcaP (DUF421 family) n=1 Tax=Natranaerovirga pectinivora TaxID=682400 RepID=A0A4R3MSS3_9FIRM|nr:DUF421 domain-containing protein [Natranaerovirga pectinivora]TCT16074.1 uncharacterized membrane protein YcaP (DUF421 family) [Natranaerovirga pectinivora]